MHVTSLIPASYHGANVVATFPKIWAWGGKKQAKLKGRETDDPIIGDIYLLTALDKNTKLLARYTLGKRNAETADILMADLEKRLVRPPARLGDMRPADYYRGEPEQLHRARCLKLSQARHRRKQTDLGIRRRTFP